MNKNSIVMSQKSGLLWVVWLSLLFLLELDSYDKFKK